MPLEISNLFRIIHSRGAVAQACDYKHGGCGLEVHSEGWIIIYYNNIFISSLWYQRKKVGVEFCQHIQCFENSETYYVKTGFSLYTMLYAGYNVTLKKITYLQESYIC